MHYGLPEKILSDQGHNFESSLITELCQTDGQCETFNSTFISIIGTLPPEPKVNGQEQISTLVNAYNCMRSNATGCSPHFFMHGRHPNLTIDKEFRIKKPHITVHVIYKYVQKLCRWLEWAYK